MTISAFNIGAFVLGVPTSPRALVRHQELLTAYADGTVDDEREGYISHFAFDQDLQAHYIAHRQSVAGFTGPCWCRWLVFDIDRADLAAALADARRLVAFLGQRYPQSEGAVPVYFSGGKGFHVLLELAHSPPPGVEFPRIARTLAEGLAASAGVEIDRSIFDLVHIIRLPNTRHPRSGLFKRRIDAEALFRLDVQGILDLARHPSGDGIPTVRGPVPQLAEDWSAAESATVRAAEARAVARRELGAVDTRAPRYLLDLVRFGVREGERHQTLFRCAAWLTEQGAPPSLCHAILAEPGCDLGLSPRDVARQIQCGIDHAQRQRAGAAGSMPDPDDYEAFERWAIEHDSDPIPPGAAEFPFGMNDPGDGPYGTAGGRR